ncbi:cytochrome P450 [Saccharopolyspora phatthalungensis]|uniref:Cytochrome P450 n=2 Tax=Saccharopolyspora phatthalungensis TaxID=664693 RepID=A0A840QFC5_9PSEU|nr:cytochrome P450 [Saccharopolyspora phatthalungensis]
MRRQCPFAPPAEYAQLREEAPLARVMLPSGRTAWVVTRHAEAQQVLADPRISTDITRPGFPALTPETPESARKRGRLHEGEFFNVDPPEHDVYRRMLIPEFSVKRVKAMRPGIQTVVDRLIDEMLSGGPPADLIESFGQPVPSMVICQLLGVAYEDHVFFQSRIRNRKMVTVAGETALARAAIAEIRAYLDDVVTRAEQEPGDNLVGRLVTERLATGELSHNALVGMIHQLLIAAHETTHNMIPLGVLTLLRHPGQLAELRADPALWPGAVDELLRYHSIVDGAGFARVAIEDIEIGGQLIRAGDGVFVLTASANHDERSFERPDDLDIHRGARNHLAFGYGVHQCLGQNLGRAWLEIAYETLFRRVPGLRAAVEVDDLPFKYDTAIFGMYEFPVAW